MPRKKNVETNIMQALRKEHLKSGSSLSFQEWILNSDVSHEHWEDEIMSKKQTKLKLLIEAIPKKEVDLDELSISDIECLDKYIQMENERFVRGRSEQIIIFVQWLEDNHSIHIHDMIVTDFLRYGK